MAGYRLKTAEELVTELRKAQLTGSPAQHRIMQVTHVLGWLSGGMSLFYLAQHAVGFGLVSALSELRNYYIALFYPIANLFHPIVLWLTQALKVSLPMWWKDGFILYLAMSLALFRYFSIVITVDLAYIDRVISVHGYGGQLAHPKTMKFICYDNRLKRQVEIIGYLTSALYALMWPVGIFLQPILDWLGIDRPLFTDALRGAPGGNDLRWRLRLMLRSFLLQVIYVFTWAAAFLALNAGLGR